MIGAIYITALIIVKVIKEWNKTLNDNEFNYVNPYHSEILRKLLESDSFTMNYINYNTKKSANKRVIKCTALAKKFSSSNDKTQIDL